MNIGIVYDAHKEEAKKHAMEAVEYLHGRFEPAQIYPEESFLKLDIGTIETLTDIVTIGGDGLVLHVANKVAPFGTGLLRVNFGDVGFLTNVESGGIFKELDYLLAGKYKKVKRVRMQGTVKRNVIINEGTKQVSEGDVFVKFDALNELVIGGIRKTVYLRLIVDGEESFEALTKGDGVMFVSQAGSTGYNLNARGPVLHTDIVFAVTAMHGMFNYKPPMPNSKLVNEYALVLEIGSKIAVQVTKQWEKHMPYLIADMDTEVELAENDIVIIERSPMSTIFLERDREERKWKIL